MKKTMMTVANAIDNTRNFEGLAQATLDAAWANHGPGSHTGSWVMLPPGTGWAGEVFFERKLKELKWHEVAAFPNGRILTAELPEGFVGHVAAVPASDVPEETMVRIDLSDPHHPAAVAEGEAKETSMITVIVEDDAAQDPDCAAFGATGPIVATWFPGPATPPSRPDGLLKDGDCVPVSEAIEHGFLTVKFQH